jgi:carbon monoxide dehydrogenase subunit G
VFVYFDHAPNHEPAGRHGRPDVKLAGQIEIAAPAERVWALINDPVALATCIPGVQDVRQIDARTFGGSITAAVGPMEGQFQFTAVVEESTYPTALVVQLSGVDSVTNSQLVATVQSSAEILDAARTRLAYSAAINVKGRLAILGEMILRATASVMIGELLKCLKARLEVVSAPPTP